MGQFTPDQLARWARARYGSTGWLALELDDFDNRALWSDHVRACHANGIKALCWFTEGYNIVTTPSDADAAIAELEGPWGGPGDWEGIHNAITWDQLPDCPLAIVTNFSAPDKDAATSIVEAGFHCMTEAYMGTNPRQTPPNMDTTARALGFAASQPVFGLWDAPESLYEPYANWQGAEYLVENVYR